MALSFEQMLILSKTVAKANPSAPTAYSFNGESFGYSELNETLREEFSLLAPDYRTYKTNQNTCKITLYKNSNKKRYQILKLP